MLAVILVISFSCKKDRRETPYSPPIPPVTPPPTVLLKDIVIPHLPSPFHAFEYAFLLIGKLSMDSMILREDYNGPGRLILSYTH